jgi:hypothetical protein
MGSTSAGSCGPRAPMQITPAEPLRDVAVGRHLTEVFGTDGVRRYDADDISATRLSEEAKQTLTWAGLPADVPFFFTADRDDAPPAGACSRTGRRRRSPRGRRPRSPTYANSRTSPGSVRTVCTR